jgi:hypothetical protein
VRGSVVILALLIGARAEAQREPGWEVRVPERVEIALGESGVLPIAIAVDRGLTVSRDAPVIVDVVLPAGVTTRKTRLGRADAVDPGADAPRFAMAVKATAAGEHVVALRLRMWLCGGRACKPLDVRRKATIAVASPEPAPPAAPSPDAGVAPDAPGKSRRKPR